MTTPNEAMYDNGGVLPTGASVGAAHGYNLPPDGVDETWQIPETPRVGVIGELPQPSGAVIELIELHHGEKYPYPGNGTHICLPNHVRINGIPVWCSERYPVAVEDIRIDGSCRAPVVALMTMHARAVRYGDATPDDNAVLDLTTEPGTERGNGVLLVVPGLSGEMRHGDKVVVPYVYLNGSALFVSGPIVIGGMTTSRHLGGYLAQVTVPLLCRRLVIDDEVLPDEQTPQKSEADEPAETEHSAVEVDQTAE